VWVSGMAARKAVALSCGSDSGVATEGARENVAFSAPNTRNRYKL